MQWVAWDLLPSPQKPFDVDCACCCHVTPCCQPCNLDADNTDICNVLCCPQAYSGGPDQASELFLMKYELHGPQSKLSALCASIGAMPFVSKWSTGCLWPPSNNNGAQQWHQEADFAGWNFGSWHTGTDLFCVSTKLHVVKERVLSEMTSVVRQSD